MKKILVLLLTLTLAISLFAGCGKKEEPATEATTEAVTEATTEATEEAVDAVTTASIVDNGQALADGLSANGTWIVATLNDIVFDGEILVDGVFYDKDDTTKDLYRKLGLYTQDADRNITAQFTLTAPKMTVKSENFSIQGGTFVGDIYVEAPGFNLGKASGVEGNIYFASQELLDGFVIHETATFTGSAEVMAVDVVTTASIVDNGQALVDGLSADGTWIVATLNDIVVDGEILVDGVFYDKDDTTKDLYRKLGLYTQDADRNITAQFTLTAPKMTVKSENFSIQGGTFVGDIYVEAPGFNLGKASSVEGNIYFASQELLDGFVIHETATFAGVTEVK